MAKSTAPRAKRTPKSTAPVVVQNIETVDADTSDAALNDLIASLSDPDEVVESTITTKTAEVDDATLEAAVSGAEATEAVMLAATPEGVVDGSAAPTGTASDVVTESAAADADTEAAPKAKKTPTPRKHYTDKTERLKDKLGTGLTEFSVLTLADAAVEDAELTAVMEATMQIIRDMNKKEQNWAVKFIEYLAGKKSSISEVTGRILRVLERDGCITTGNEGNVFKDLVARPYSPGAARAMGGNNIGMLRDLKLIVLDSKGKYVGNPDSLLLAKAKSMLFAAPAAAPEAAAA